MRSIVHCFTVHNGFLICVFTILSLSLFTVSFCKVFRLMLVCVCLSLAPALSLTHAIRIHKFHLFSSNLSLTIFVLFLERLTRKNVKNWCRHFHFFQLNLLPQCSTIHEMNERVCGKFS